MDFNKKTISFAISHQGHKEKNTLFWIRHSKTEKNEPKRLSSYMINTNAITVSNLFLICKINKIAFAH